MSSVCGSLVAIILIIGLPASIIWLIVFAIKKKKIKAPLISITTCVVAMIVFTAIGTASWTKTDDYQEYLAEKSKEDSERAEQEKQKEELARLQEQEAIEKAKQEEIETELLAEKTEQQNICVDSKVEAETEKQVVETEKNISEIKPTETNEQTKGEDENIDASSLSEEEYKKLCEELWHDDIFFSEDNLEGKHVKLDLFVEESRFFKTEAHYIESVSRMIDEYNLCRDLFSCGVQREAENSYVLGQISLYFSNDYDISPSDISIGDHLIVYGEIIDYSKDYYDGYNDCHIVARYIENKGQ